MQALKAGAREGEQIPASLPTMRRLQAKGTPAVPTVCIQGGRVDRGMSKTRPVFNQTAEQLMAAVPDGRVVVVPGAGHLVPQEQPAVVRDVILEVVEAARVAT